MIEAAPDVMEAAPDVIEAATQCYCGCLRQLAELADFWSEAEADMEVEGARADPQVTFLGACASLFVCVYGPSFNLPAAWRARPIASGLALGLR